MQVVEKTFAAVGVSQSYISTFSQSVFLLISGFSGSLTSSSQIFNIRLQAKLTANYSHIG